MEIKGDTSKARFFAATIDNLIAIGLMLVIVGSMPENWSVLRAIFIVIGYLGYFFIFEGLWGRTLGKYFQGLVVRNLNGAKAGWGSTLIRTLLRIIEVNPALFGAIPAGLIIISSERKQRIGDMLANTVVVSDTLNWSVEDISDHPHE